MHRLALALALAPLVLGAAIGCSNESSARGGSSASKSVSACLDDASAAIEAKEWKTALVSLDAAIADARATRDEKVQAWQDKILCESQLGGDEAGKKSVHDLADAKIDMTPSDFAKLGGDLANADQLVVALAVLEVATKRFEGDASAKSLFAQFAKRLQAKFEASGDTAGQAALRGLGYLGD